MLRIGTRDLCNVQGSTRHRAQILFALCLLTIYLEGFVIFTPPHPYNLGKEMAKHRIPSQGHYCCIPPPLSGSVLSILQLLSSLPNPVEKKGWEWQDEGNSMTRDDEFMKEEYQK